jgi:hypothetical protein
MATVTAAEAVRNRIDTLQLEKIFVHMPLLPPKRLRPAGTENDGGEVTSRWFKICYAVSWSLQAIGL